MKAYEPPQRKEPQVEVLLKVLIVAAGKGTRLSRKNDSKPLIPVLGLSLIERTILTARRSGITKFCIVTGYDGDKIRNHLRDGKKYGVEIEYVQNDQWDGGNGISVLKARKCFRETFVCLMSDHIYDSRMLDGLLTTMLGKDECFLYVDRNFPPHLEHLNSDSGIPYLAMEDIKT